MQQTRGVINNRGRAKQILDFRGLVFGKITPTNFDGVIEYKNMAYIIIEVKLEDNILPFGQNLALERITDDLTCGGKPTLLVISSHTILNCSNDVDVAKTIVREFRLNGMWRTPTHPITTRDIIDRFINNNFVL